MAHYSLNKVRFSVAVTVLIAALPVIAQENKPQTGGNVVAVITGDPVVTNPDVTSLLGDQFVGCLIYDGLVNNKLDGTSEPALATSWTISPDGLTYSFKLRNAEWQDGKPFTSEDVKYTLTQVSAKYSPVFSAGGKLIKSIDAVGDHQVDIHLSAPYGAFLHSLACSTGGAILPAHVYRDKGDVMTNPATTTAPIGTGPFRLVEWQRGNFLRFAKNARYWDAGKPYLDGVVAQIIPQSSSRVQALRSGEVDFLSASLIAYSDLPIIEKSPQLKLSPSNLPPSQDMIFMNNQNKYLANKDVRKALMVATDREYLVRTIFGGRSLVGRGPFTSRIAWAFNKDIDYMKMYPFSVADANARLDKAGLAKQADGSRFSLNLAYDSGDGDSTRLVQAIQGMWKEVGVKVVLQPLDRPTISKRVFNERQFDLVYWTYGSYGDPAVGLARIYSSSTIGTTFGNPSGYSNPKVDEYFVKGAGAVDVNARAAEYKKAAAILAEDLPVLVTTSKLPFDASTKKLKGVWGSEGYGKWGDAWLSK